MDLKLISYIINELGEDRENYFNAVSPPIIQTSNFSFNKVDQLRKAFEDEYSTFIQPRLKPYCPDFISKACCA